MGNARDTTAAAINAVGISPNESDSNGEPANLVDGLFAIARALQGLTYQVKQLGVGDTDGMGAVEFAAVRVATALNGVAAAIDTTGGRED